MGSTNKKNMSAYLAQASLVMKKSDAIRPIVPSQGQPTMGQSAAIEGIQIPMDYGYNEPTNNRQPYGQQAYSQQSPDGASKLPKSILESIQNNPISDYVPGGGGSFSVLDDIIPIQHQPQRRMMNESSYMGGGIGGEKDIPSTEELIYSRMGRGASAGQQYNQQPVQQQQSIDYSIISSIIKTTIAEEMVKLRKDLLNDAKKNGEVIIRVGSDVKFIAKNGNVYAGNVKLVGNINQ